MRAKQSQPPLAITNRDLHKMEDSVNRRLQEGSVDVSGQCLQGQILILTKKLYKWGGNPDLFKFHRLKIQQADDFSTFLGLYIGKMEKWEIRFADYGR